ncbi:MAG: hypothetical protein QM785_12205 [Pyrinomonadaceae bacterium]
MESKRRPFWLPASNYYVLSVAVSTAFFFLVWGILHDSGEETPWVTAGISASLLLCVAVILREVILRRARNRFLRQQRMMENRVRSAHLRSQINSPSQSSKLTVEQNAILIKEIEQKAEAARLLGRFAASHRDVFELCGEYIALTENELKTINANSPRLAPLLKGRSVAADYHRFHLLKWAEIETKSLSADAQNRPDADARVEAAQKALSVIETSLGYYPQEKSLLESRIVLQEMIVSIKVSDWIERAERAAFEGDNATAKSLYRDALFYLGRDNIENAWREEAAIRIDREIENLNARENKKQDLSK